MLAKPYVRPRVRTGRIYHQEHAFARRRWPGGQVSLGETRCPWMCRGVGEGHACRWPRRHPLQASLQVIPPSAIGIVGVRPSRSCRRLGVAIPHFERARSELMDGASPPRSPLATVRVSAVACPFQTPCCRPADRQPAPSVMLPSVFTSMWIKRAGVVVFPAAHRLPGCPVHIRQPVEATPAQDLRRGGGCATPTRAAITQRSA